MSEREDLILVRWQDEQDGGWREGVVCVVVNKARFGFGDTHVITNDIAWEIKNWQSWLASHSPIGRAIIYDRHRHERAIVPLAKVQIVEPRCEVCDGTGVDCDACHGSGKRA